MTQQNFVTSIGRVVGGNLYKAKDKDATGAPLRIKSGPDAGKATQKFEFAVAFPKVPGQHWWHLVAQLANGQQSAFGAIIYQAGAGGFPQGQYNQPNFAWKVTDGDSTIPNGRGKKPCDNEGYPGHWVFWFSSRFPPKIVNKDGSAYILEADAIKPGYFVQVSGSVDANGDLMKPGVFLNHNVVSLQGYGAEISNGPDPSVMGFGGGAPVAGMQAAPVAGVAPIAPIMPPAGPVNVAPPVMPPVAPPAMPVQPAAPVAPPVAVMPHPGFIQPPPLPGAGVASPAPAAPSVPAMPSVPAPPVAPVRQMLPKAGGASYESFVANGWTDDLLRANGYMV